MRQTVRINGVTTKTSKDGKEYKSYQTNEGSLTCFEQQISKMLDLGIGQSADLEIEISPNGKFKNIRGFHGLIKNPVVEQVQSPKEPDLPSPAIKPKVELSAGEPKFRINLKQNAKGVVYWDATIRADDKDEAEMRLNEASEVAIRKCKTLNGDSPEDFSKGNEGVEQ